MCFRCQLMILFHYQVSAVAIIMSGFRLHKRVYCYAFLTEKGFLVHPGYNGTESKLLTVAI